MTMPRIYIASAYSIGDTMLNIRAALDAADAVLTRGGAPFVPHLNGFLHLCHPHDYETWLALDLVWLAQCEALWRLPGISAGADREVAEAQRLGLSVLWMLTEVDAWLRARREEAPPC
jgi:hypothetical protein